ncbi:dioxygenase [Brevibacillus sp. SYP-B805]|uniref:DODA-type extradiol aromatic ring-opening family dioxygenase n=1 Tax=Brevibacillus sp. SYP-B805 TaxID=1578199 RepID=UPI0013EE10A7|nr:class III extradiol ring-cleavage dioxygenase [Brevibacillus sp. SYP-B805]NGQ95298.1 dioxygenase [Brevibacillus sp. SYP-B805]
MTPSFFICHGAPDIAIQQTDYTRFLNGLSQTFAKPKAILVFSAHWESRTLSLTYTDDTYETIYDFGGFPDELYRITYPAKGSTAVAEEVVRLFEEQGIPVQRDMVRGLDHGAWVVLRLIYPEADIPVIALSVNPFLPPEEQYRIGKALGRLREEDVLIIGSGATSHNLRMLKWGQQEPEAWTTAFDDWLIDAVENWRTDALFAYEEQAPYAKLAVPRPEHFVPLFLAMGSGDGRKQAALLHRSYDLGTLSYICFRFD